VRSQLVAHDARAARHPQRFEDPRPHRCIERVPGLAPDDLGEQLVRAVVVLHLDTWCCYTNRIEREREEQVGDEVAPGRRRCDLPGSDDLLDPVGPLRRLPPGRVCEEVVEQDLVVLRAIQLGEVVHHGLVDADATLLDERHRQRSGDRLACRGDRPDIVDVERFTMWAAHAECLGQHDLASPQDDCHRRWRTTGRDMVRNEIARPADAFARHSYALGVNALDGHSCPFACRKVPTRGGKVPGPPIPDAPGPQGYVPHRETGACRSTTSSAARSVIRSGPTSALGHAEDHVLGEISDELG
jgi:hypothetical protein